MDWPFGTEVILDGTTWVCVDRGAFIGHDSRTGAPIVDFMTDRPPYPFKAQVEAVVIFPGEEIEFEELVISAPDRQLKLFDWAGHTMFYNVPLQD
jgi:hypothetical protein